MKFKSLLAVLALTLTTSVFASQQQKPERCPSVDALKSENFAKVAVLPDANQWVVVGAVDNKYDTTDDWTFVVTVKRGNAETKDAAYQLARKSLASLSFVRGPELFDGLNAYGCVYGTAEQNVLIFTVTKLFGFKR